jgi:RND family efflux transporter MFP subunit
MCGWHDSKMAFLHSRRALLVLAALSLPACGPKQEAPPPAPPVVLVTKAAMADVPNFGETIATLNGSTNIEIRAQVTGYLIRQDYSEGSVVKPGDILFEIDPKPFQANLDKALATLASNQAQLKRSQEDLARYAALVKSGAVSQQEYQNEFQNSLSAQANVDAAQANVVTAKINLGYARIASPIEGVAGHASVNIGDLISPNLDMTAVSTINPIRADFTLSEQFYLDNAENIARASAVPMNERPENLELVLADGSVYPRRGRFAYVNRQVQTSTGAIAAYAYFPNPDGILRPGQYTKVRAVLQQIHNAVVIPQRCVTQLQDLNQVMVVKPDNTVEVRNVTLGKVAGPNWIITSGLQDGERVVVEGLLKCRDGAPVTPQPYVAPAQAQPATNAPGSLPPLNP